MNAIVSIMMGSDSDAEVLKPCGDILKEFGVAYDVRVLSAHRTPDEAIDYAKKAKSAGIRVMICAAGGAAHLAGVVAANTELPVIGIPVETSALNGMDSLLSTVQMPAGTPVGTVAIGSGGVRNAAYLALRILALGDEKVAAKLKEFKEKNRDKVLSKKINW